MTAPRAKLDELRKIPSVNELLLLIQSCDWASSVPQTRMADAVRRTLETVRERILRGDEQMPEMDFLVNAVRAELAAESSFSLRRVINASGIIVHTNLGRAPLAAEAIEHLAAIAGGYSNLEFDLEHGVRGSRDKHLTMLLSRLFPAEASLVVNNNAAALLLILNTLAEDKEVIVSRGELVEIGGSFRLPEIMKKSHAILREVGTTNKTRLDDYRDAIGENTGMILLVHPSNYQIIGFTERPELSDLVELGTARGIPVVEDHGSGIITDLEPHGIPDEPRVTERLRMGLDLACFSGDKILGGPQAGIICGKKELIARLRKNPMFRALRVDKMVYAVLEATLRLYLMQQPDRIPVLRMISISREQLNEAAQAWRVELQRALPGISVSIESTVCYIGGGVAPMKGINSWAIALQHQVKSAQQIAGALRKSDPPIVARVAENRLYFELRTLTHQERDTITTALQTILKMEN